MRKSRFSDEQIALALRQAEAGTPVAEICRQLEITETTFYRWKKRFGGMGVSELRELKQLREESWKLKSLVADLSLDKTILQEAARENKGEASPVPPRARRGAAGVWAGRETSVSGTGREPLERALP